jgi:tRNA (guanine37-N1)-methyltransferase
MTNPWSATVLTLFPEMFPGPLGQSIIGKALDKGLWSLKAVNIRDFATDKHQTVDDTCFGGGPGMVMRPDVLDKALHSVTDKGQARVINMSPRGKTFNQALARELAEETRPIVIINSRYEGIDQRALDEWDVEDISLGDFVMAGGELASMTMIEAIVRLLPGVLGDAESIDEESFSTDLLEYSHYTKPREWQGHEVPEVLTTGHHANIQKWRQEMAEKITQDRRPDLWQKYVSKEKDYESFTTV